VLVYLAFSRFFATLPLCCLIDDRIFCVHGGVLAREKVLERRIKNKEEWLTKYGLNGYHSEEFKGSKGLLTYEMKKDLMLELAKNLNMLDEIRKIDRCSNTLARDTVTDLLWSDPMYVNEKKKKIFFFILYR
jgi:diadenosine tetraphosphatase ApaH/serine/threonine PP2A family protein phosphatase